METALHKKFHQLNVAASPPDVRQGYALPDDLSFSMAGYALGAGLAPKDCRPKAAPGA